MSQASVQLVGTLIRDPEFKTAADGTNVITVAIRVPPKATTGYVEPLRVQCVAFGGRAVAIDGLGLTKGNRVLCLGRLKGSHTVDRESGKVYDTLSVEIDVIGPATNGAPVR